MDRPEPFQISENANGQNAPLLRERLVTYDGDSRATSNDFTSDGGLPTQKKVDEGIGFWQAVFAITGMMSGYTGTVLMTGIIYTGWLGVLIYVIVTLVMTYTATLLGSCWAMVQENWMNDRHPYGAIAYEAGGKWARVAINVVVDVNCFGGDAVMLLIVSDIVYMIMGPMANGTFCYWPLGFGLVVCPFMWLGSPKDSWQFGAFSFMSCALAFLLIFIDGATSIESHGHMPSLPYNSWHLSLVTGTSIFMIITHYALPLVQRDVRSPEKFGRCAVTAYGAFFAIFFPVLIVGYFGFGSLVEADTGGISIFYLQQRDALTITALFMLLLNSLLLMVLATNPLFHHLEDLLDIPEEFGFRRVIVRSLVTMLIVFCVETFPQIAVLMTLVSALLATPLAFFAPALCYLRLRRIYGTDSLSSSRFRYLVDTIACVGLIALSPVVSFVTSAVTVKAIADGETLFVSPCYVNATAAHV